MLWPGFLALLGLAPLLVGGYIWMLRRRQRFAVRFSSLSLVREAMGQPSRLRRHLPFALFVIGLSSLVVALSRPVAVVHVPTGQSTIILAMDVSGSMCQTDIRPSRLDAAQAAALGFIQDQEARARIGVVAFAGFAELVQSPTDDLELLQDAVESLITGRRTAIGSAIVASLDAISEVDSSVPPVTVNEMVPTEPALPDGTYAPAIIVLLTDGASNTGVWPWDAAQLAADRGVRVYTIGFGTAGGGGGRLAFCGQGRLNTGIFGPGSGFGGGQFRRGLDEPTLRLIADRTGGAYFSAESASELREVFENLPTHLVTRQETMEVSVYFTALGAALAALAIVFSLLWHPLP